VLMEAKHPACARALWGAGWYVGVALAHACTLLDPQRIYLGGTLTTSREFRTALEQAIAETALPSAVPVGGLRTSKKLPERPELGKPIDGLVHPLPAELARSGWGSAELLGAVALVIHRLGDAYIAKRISEADLGQ
jgi:predicted NBD/HSP70 family sugar kinase